MKPERIKVVFLINSLGGGGAEKIMKLLLENIDQNRFDLSLCITREDKIEYDIKQDIIIHIPLFNDIKINKANVLIIKIISFVRCLLPPYNNNNILQRFVSIEKEIILLYKNYIGTKKYVEYVGPDVIVSFLFNSSFIAIILKYFSKSNFKVVCSDHCTLTKELKNFFPLSYNFLPRILFKGTDAYVAVSNGVKLDLINNYKLKEKYIRVIYNGTDLEDVREQSKVSIAPSLMQFFPSDNVFSIVNVGRLAAPKNQVLLLKAFQIVRRHCVSRLYLVGQGELLDDLKILSRSLGIESDVYFLGWQPNPFNIMAKCDLFVLSSSWEAFPNVLVEAMAVGLPVVSTNCPTGPEEALAQGAFGDLVPTDDFKALADAVILMYEDRMRLHEFANLSRMRANSFSLPKMVSAYEDMLEELVMK